MDHDVAEQERLPERYILGELSPAEREEFEEHYFCCPRCGESVRYATMLAANSRAVFAEEAKRSDPARASSRWNLASWLRWPVLAPSAVAAALAVVTAYQGLVVIPALRRATEPQMVASAALRPTARGDEQVIEVQPSARFFHLSLDINSSARYASYESDFLNAGGESVFRVPAPCCETTTLSLLLPADRFPEGAYTLVLKGIGGSGPAEIDRYRFRLKKR